jgi:hypothetical protein
LRIDMTPVAYGCHSARRFTDIGHVGCRKDLYLSCILAVGCSRTRRSERAVATTLV